MSKDVALSNSTCHVNPLRDLLLYFVKKSIKLRF